MSIDVWFVMLPGVLSLDMTGPAETFVLAGDAFRLHCIGPQPEVPTSIGLTMSGIQLLPDFLESSGSGIVGNPVPNDRVIEPTYGQSAAKFAEMPNTALSQREDGKVEGNGRVTRDVQGENIAPRHG